MEKKTISFIGAGQMAGAIINGAIKQNFLKPEEIGIFDINLDKLQYYKNLGLTIFEGIVQLVENSKIVLIAAKPQDFKDILPEIKGGMDKDKIIVSIAAGITGEQIQNAMGFDCKVILVMPNTPLLLGEGATGIAKMDSVNDSEFEQIKSLFESVGIVEEVSPNQLNDVISISGSTPAFVYKFADAVVKNAEKSGVPYDKAMNLFVQTLIGSAQMLIESGKAPEELISMVCSPGGTTIEGMKTLDRLGFDKAIEAACKACVKRANELSEKKENANLKLKKVEYESPEYYASKFLRERVLREPLGLKLTEKDIADDHLVTHIVVTKCDEIVAAGQLFEKDSLTGQAKQIVVEPDQQKTGLGRIIMDEIKEEALLRGYKKIFLNSRDYAVGFYEKLGYVETDNKFEIMGIPHITMYLDLQ